MSSLPAVAGEVLEAQAQAAHEIAERIQKHVTIMRTVWIRLAEDLYRFSEQEMWRDLGHGSFEAWLASPEIELERRWVYDLKAMWRELVVDRDVKPAQLERLAVSKVREVLPAIRRGHVEITAALADAETLTRSDLELKYRGLSSRAEADRPLDADDEPEFAICHACGSRYPVRSAA